MLPQLALAFYLGGMVAMLPLAIGVRDRDNPRSAVPVISLSLLWPVTVALTLTGLVKFTGDAGHEQ